MLREFRCERSNVISTSGATGATMSTVVDSRKVGASFAYLQLCRCHAHGKGHFLLVQLDSREEKREV